MALHAYSQSQTKRPTLRVVDSPRPVRALTRKQSALVASAALGLPFVVALIVLGAGR